MYIFYVYIYSIRGFVFNVQANPKGRCAQFRRPNPIPGMNQLGYPNSYGRHCSNLQKDSKVIVIGLD